MAMPTADSGLFLVEHRLPRITEPELALLQAALIDACIRLTARGERVDYVRSTFLPGSERLLSLFKAADADLVRSVSESSQAQLAYVEIAVEMPAPIG